MLIAEEQESNKTTTEDSEDNILEYYIPVRITLQGFLFFEFNLKYGSTSEESILCYLSTNNKLEN
ncbi:hypothetical protein GCM10008905_25050 [Clostridium malenominatum]|uniref:Uncharacterized protein n=1 Tax=Clostridium malenominatum TaxID=1539 RepID=A0ABN1J388_9CLOT